MRIFVSVLIPVCSRIHPEHKEQLKKISYLKGKSLSQLVRDILSSYLSTQNTNKNE